MTRVLAALLVSTSLAYSAELSVDEPCDECNIDLNPYVEQACEPDQLLYPSLFRIYNEDGEYVPVYGNLCVYEDDDLPIFHEVGYGYGVGGFGFGASGFGGGGGGSWELAPPILVADPKPLPPRPPKPPVPTPPEVPLPGTFWLFASGLAMIAGGLWWRA